VNNWNNCENHYGPDNEQSESTIKNDEITKSWNLGCAAYSKGPELQLTQK
jgi:hypothetical protein